jgi:hypothetical protein
MSINNNPAANDPLRMEWVKFETGTMQCVPLSKVCYRVIKTRVVTTNPAESATIYILLKRTENDWLQLGATDTFAEAKEIAARADAERI